MLVTADHEADPLALRERAVHDADEHHGADVGVEPGVEDQRLGRLARVPARRRNPIDDRLEHRLDALPRLGRHRQHVGGVEPDHVLDLLRDAHGIRRRQIDLVHDRDQLEVRVDREIGVGERLGLDALGGVDDQERAFAGGERPRDLVGEIDVAGGVDQVQDVVLAVGGAEVHARGLGLDRDPALALEIHVVEELILPLAIGERVGRLEQSIGERATCRDRCGR